MTTRRRQRLSELLHEELSILVSGELTDPRLADAMVTVTDVAVAADMRSARVYVEHSLPAAESRAVLARPCATRRASSARHWLRI